MSTQEAAREIARIVRAGAWTIPHVAWIDRGALVATSRTFGGSRRALLRSIGNTFATRISTDAEGTVRLAPSPGTGRNILQALDAVASGETPPRRAPTLSVDVSRRAETARLAGSAADAAREVERVPVLRWHGDWKRTGWPFVQRSGDVDGMSVIARFYPLQSPPVLATWVDRIPSGPAYWDATTWRYHLGTS